MTDSHIASAAGRHQQRLKVVLAITATVMLAEVAAGLISGSLALLADAGHMLTDVAGVGLALIAIRMAARPASDWADLWAGIGSRSSRRSMNAVLLFGGGGLDPG